MKAFLLHAEKDFELDARLPPGHETLVEDLGLEDVFAAMAAGDRYLLEASRTVVLAGLRDPGEIVYRQQVLQDCIGHAQVVRQLYDIAVAAVETERQAWRIYTQNPDLVVSMATRTLELLVPLLRHVRRIADSQAASFESPGFTTFFATLRRELDDAYLWSLEEHLRTLGFRHGLSLDGRLGRRNTGTGFVLVRPSRRGWQRWLRGSEGRGHTIDVPQSDDAGLQALADLRARGINLVANAIGQAVDHTISFFEMVRFEVGFYLACLNLREQLLAVGQPVSFPEPQPRGTGVLSARGLCDVGLSLRLKAATVGNDLDANRRSLIMVTGANQGGKSTFLRSLGLAQVLMQAGLFVGAAQFRADVRASVFSHFKRREDPTMESGKLDEELRRFSAIADVITPNAVVLFNESFAATNEREGADIAEAIVRALLEAGARVAFVTHAYELARRFHQAGRDDVLFLRAERLPDGRRTFRQREGEPLATSYGDDLFRRIFGEAERV